MNFTLRDYQQDAVALAHRFLLSAKPGEKLLIAAPTGTGKSLMELAAQTLCPGLWIITPRVEIMAGLLEKKLGRYLQELSLDKLVDLAWQHQITTPVRLRNTMLAGSGPDIRGLIIDEAHHYNADTYQQLDLLTGIAPAVGFTATPYRGTPRSTADFRKTWGDPVWVLTYPDAVARGVLSFPEIEILPLIDDDQITISNGEFQVESVARESRSRLADLANWCNRFYSVASGWDRPTIFAMPDTETARQFCDIAVDLDLTLITQETSTRNRQRAFGECVDRQTAIVQINVVSEGVDLQIRRLIDFSPMISPVRWLQQFGRITRPGGSSHYVCTNRNVLRHAYLLDGCIPSPVFAAAQEAFGGIGARSAVRVVGLEAVGRLKSAEIPLRDGAVALCYNVSTVQGSRVSEYCVLAHPLRAEPIWATRERPKNEPGKPFIAGPWRRCEPPTDLAGYSSCPASPVSPKQAAWWKRAAERHGLDPDAKVTRKNFVALPVLANLKVSL